MCAIPASDGGSGVGVRGKVGGRVVQPFRASDGWDAGEWVVRSFE